MTTYTITVPVSRRVTTDVAATSRRTFRIEGESTVLGGMRAISEAIDAAGDRFVDDGTCGWPTIDPNPADLGWPMS